MAENEKASPVKAASSSAPPESPTTARPLDFDDEPQETGLSSQTVPPTAIQYKSAPSSDIPPPKPPRPLSPREQAENTLKEAFPTIDATVIKAVLAASGGKVEPAFNALLGMSDPDSQVEPEPAPPAKPPRPTQQAQSQVEADEQYARQLHEHYSGTASQRGQRQRKAPTNQQPRVPRQSQPVANPNDPYAERERSFIDDDLPEIRDNIRKGFLETQSTVNKWVMNLKKKIDGEDEEDFNSQPARPAQNYSTGNQSYGRRSSEMARRSADRERYDADPQVLGDDFSRLEMRDTEEVPRRPNRPLANPDLFKSSPSGRKVSFQDGPPEEINDLYSGMSNQPGRPSSGGKSKWQPLSVVEPSPVAENDPFSLGDSDDEKETKVKESKNAETDKIHKETGLVDDGVSGTAKSESDKAKVASKP